MTNEQIVAGFLSRHPTFGGWEDTWEGVPLAARVGLTNEVPPREVVASVRAIVLRGDKVLLVRTPTPLLTVGGRPEPHESLTEGLIREVAEETGWLVDVLGVIGFTHVRHLDGQRPAWGRPAPNFIDVIHAVEARTFDAARQHPGEPPCEFVRVASVESHGAHLIDRTLLQAALRCRDAARGRAAVEE